MNGGGQGEYNQGDEEERGTAVAQYSMMEEGAERNMGNEVAGGS